MRIFLLTILLIAAAGAAVFYVNVPLSPYQDLLNSYKDRLTRIVSIDVSEYTAGSERAVPVDAEAGHIVEPPDVKEVTGEVKVMTSKPLRVMEDDTGAQLTRSGVVIWTNTQRIKEGLFPLAPSSVLNQVAEAKLADMFDNQYFEHVSPDGNDASDLARREGYEFVLIGENLALGNFDNDQVLVQAWMDSPGHRANILNGGFQEIGVAVEEGEFEGRTVWLAVQTFGTPVSACPAIDNELRDEIEKENAELQSLSSELGELYDEIQSLPPAGPNYRNKVETYNSLANQYNGLLKKLEDKIDTYNSQVNEFNECVEKLQ